MQQLELEQPDRDCVFNQVQRYKHFVQCTHKNSHNARGYALHEFNALRSLLKSVGLYIRRVTVATLFR